MLIVVIYKETELLCGLTDMSLFFYSFSKRLDFILIRMISTVRSISVDIFNYLFCFRTILNENVSRETFSPVLSPAKVVFRGKCCQTQNEANCFT